MSGWAAPVSVFHTRIRDDEALTRNVWEVPRQLLDYCNSRHRSSWSGYREPAKRVAKFEL